MPTGAGMAGVEVQLRKPSVFRGLAHDGDARRRRLRADRDERRPVSGLGAPGAGGTWPNLPSPSPSPARRSAAWRSECLRWGRSPARCAEWRPQNWRRSPFKPPADQTAAGRWARWRRAGAIAWRRWRPGDWAVRGDARRHGAARRGPCPAGARRGGGEPGPGVRPGLGAQRPCAAAGRAGGRRARCSSKASMSRSGATRAPITRASFASKGLETGCVRLARSRRIPRLRRRPRRGAAPGR